MYEILLRSSQFKTTFYDGAVKWFLPSWTRSKRNVNGQFKAKWQPITGYRQQYSVRKCQSVCIDFLFRKRHMMHGISVTAFCKVSGGSICCNYFHRLVALYYCLVLLSLTNARERHARHKTRDQWNCLLEHRESNRWLFACREIWSTAELSIVQR